MAGTSYTKVANGNIPPSRFVKLDTTAEGRVLLCGAGERVYGVSQPGTRNAPYSSLDDGFAAIAGENLQIYGPGDKDIPLELGGTVTIGARLKSDVSGRAVATTTNLDEYGAIAMASGTSNQLIPVQVVEPTQVSS